MKVLVHCLCIVWSFKPSRLFYKVDLRLYLQLMNIIITTKSLLPCVASLEGKLSSKGLDITSTAKVTQVGSFHQRKDRLQIVPQVLGIRIYTQRTQEGLCCFAILSQCQERNAQIRPKRTEEAQCQSLDPLHPRLVPCSCISWFYV